VKLFCQIFSKTAPSTRKAAPSEEPELELFLEEPEPCQTGAMFHFREFKRKMIKFEIVQLTT